MSKQAASSPLNRTRRLRLIAPVGYGIPYPTGAILYTFSPILSHTQLVGGTGRDPMALGLGVEADGIEQVGQGGGACSVEDALHTKVLLG